MKTIRLYGSLRKKFGKEFRLDVGTPAEGIHALRCQVPGFRKHFQDHAADRFRVVVGGEDRDEAGLCAPCGRSEVIKIVPVVAGAKEGGFQFILGAVLTIVGTVYAMPWLSNIGMSMMLGGVAQMLADSPKGMFNPSTTTSDIETFTFNSPTATTGQGGSVPVLYGQHRVSGHVISAGIDAQTWQDKGFGGAAPDNDGTRGGDGSASPWVWAIAP